MTILIINYMIVFAEMQNIWGLCESAAALIKWLDPPQRVLAPGQYKVAAFWNV